MCSKRQKMEQSDHASIDMKELAESLRTEVKNLYPLSEECCIFRVPEAHRCLNPSHYTPKMVSIGPIHHERKELEAMKEHKIRYLGHFLERTKLSIEDILALIKNREANLRNCYGETILLESDDFVRIILVDAVFLIELCLRLHSESFITDDDRIYGKPWVFQLLKYDLWLVENQLPLFILIELFDLAKTATCGEYCEGLSLLTITLPLVEESILSVENNLLEHYFLKAKHFLDWLVLCLQRSQSPTKTVFKEENIPSAKELHQAGVKIVKSQSRKSLLDIEFNGRILEVPFLRVYDDTECLFHNMLVFEDMHNYSHYFNDYILLMSYLVSTTKDAELFIEKGVIRHRSGDELSTIFQNLNKNCGWHPNFQYSDVVASLQKHCKNPYNKWKAILKQNYFNSPWASISVIAAFILLVLTFIQTTCSVIGL